jgi:lycopene cyclase domain-containing protein
MFGHSTYFFVLAITFTAPFILGFHPSVHFNQQWRKIAKGLFWIGCVYIPWDIVKTYFGVWSFNQSYISGIFFFNLPIEEVLFFVTTPFACLFTFASFQYHWPKLIKSASNLNYGKMAKALYVVLIVLALLVLIQKPFGWYTASAILAALVTTTLAFRKLPSMTFTQAVISWMVLLIPFYICNGILTGLHFWEYPFWNSDSTAIKDAVVLYNNDENCGMRIWSVPLEDFFYGIGFFWISVLNWKD